MQSASSASAVSSTSSAVAQPAVDAVGPAADVRAAHRFVAALATVRLRVHANGLALAVLAALAVLYTLSWAERFLVPLLLGIVIAYTLNPVVAWLEAIRIPRVAGTVIVMASVIGALVLGTYSLRDEVQAIVEQLPQAASKVSTAIQRAKAGEAGAMEKLQKAASEVEKATSQATAVAPTPRQPGTHVIIDRPAFKLSDVLWDGTMGALAAAGQAATVVFLVFFLLLGGDQFKRKLVRMTGPSLTNKKITVKILDDINGSIQKYMFMLLTTNLLVALLTWIAFRWIGLENAGAWAVAAGFLHIVPYLGPAAAAAATGMAAFMQFESISTALLVAGASLAIATVVGTFVTTWMIGRIANMNAAAIFISLLFWGWLWGVWGMLLSIPIIVIVKVLSQHVEQLSPLAELLGD